jgi:adenylate kinase family enzyme
MKITILGLPGSGKSTLARKITANLQIPYIHIDQFWMEAGGGHNSRTTVNAEYAHAHVREKVLEAIQAESWVSDGVYGLIQPQIAKKADQIIYLDIPLWRRLINHAARTIHRENRSGEMTFWADVQFFPEIIRRDFTKKSKIKNLLNTYEDKVCILRSRKEINAYEKSLLNK